MKINNPNQFVLCCRSKKCPIVTFDEDRKNVVITDDFQNSVKMSTEQFMEIGNVINHIQTQKDS